MSKVYFIMLHKDEEVAKEVFSQLTKMGLSIDGHFYKDDLENMGWVSFKKELEGGGYKAWIILGTKEDWERPSIRQGLSLLEIGKEPSIKTILLFPSGKSPQKEELPPVFRGSEMVEMDSGFAAKVVAKVHLPVGKEIVPYRITPYGVPGMGLWLEIGPAKGVWKGVLIGVKDAEIRHMGIGERGRLPERSVLEYPVRDMKLEVNGEEYIAWAVKNEISSSTSAFVNVSKVPTFILFGEWREEALECYNLSLL